MINKNSEAHYFIYFNKYNLIDLKLYQHFLPKELNHQYLVNFFNN